MREEVLSEKKNERFFVKQKQQKPLSFGCLHCVQIIFFNVLGSLLSFPLAVCYVLVALRPLLLVSLSLSLFLFFSFLFLLSCSVLLTKICNKKQCLAAAKGSLLPCLCASLSLYLLFFVLFVCLSCFSLFCLPTDESIIQLNEQMEHHVHTHNHKSQSEKKTIYLSFALSL